MISVERVNQYLEIQPEISAYPPIININNLQKTNWPFKGEIEFKFIFYYYS